MSIRFQGVSEEFQDVSLEVLYMFQCITMCLRGFRRAFKYFRRFQGVQMLAEELPEGSRTVSE